ncbi:MAG: Na/Pi cotransporter family protein [Treponema sp.]|nr:Na/Pi cotransporter family protein [Treponema sp.]
MKILQIIFQFAGSLSFLLFGMKLMSDGIQKSASKSLHKALSLMTGNRFLGMLTGVFITLIIQSSSATTVMVVSFVNAGLMTLAQAIGVIFGANIGTTVTAWIVAIFGFKFHIAALAIPLFGIGYLLKNIKQFNKPNIGEAVMGFGLLFLGLDLLKDVMTVDASQITFLSYFNDKGNFGLFIGLIAGVVVTAIIHSSSASTAIILTLSHQGLLSWEFAAAMVIGSNIGTTIDAVLASWGTKVNARRAALVHVLFNAIGSILAMFVLRPFLSLVDFIVPGPVQGNEPTHLAMLHTIFNVINTILFMPFVTPLARFTEKIIKPKDDEIPNVYKLEMITAGGKENIGANILRAEKEIVDMIGIAMQMLNKVQIGFKPDFEGNIDSYIEDLRAQEEYADQMQEQLSQFIVKCSQMSITDKTQNNLSIMLHIIDEIENMTDDCLSIGLLVHRSINKQTLIAREEMERLDPYLELVNHFLIFIKENLNKTLSEEKLRYAETIENKIDIYRAKLKRIARKRLECGADVRSELIYIDIIRYIEKIGDRAFEISEALVQTK